MANREPERWITRNGKHIPIYADDESGFKISKEQREFEESIRGLKTEHIAFFDKDGNKLFETEGTEEDVTFGNRYEDSDDWDKTVAFNHNVEQRVWDDEEIYDVHNHPENTIFSPEDIEAFEALENKAARIVLPNGETYTLVREQPRTSNAIIIDTKTGESHREFEPKKIAPAYDAEYSKVYLKRYDDIIKEYRADARKLKLAELDKDVKTHMTKWLEKNAEKYGYKFISEK